MKSITSNFSNNSNKIFEITVKAESLNFNKQPALRITFW